MQSKDLSYFITCFFTQYLTSEKNLSDNTVKAYRDTFLLLLLYLKDQRGLRIEKLSVQDLSRDNIVCFLDWLENDRGNSIGTRNQRLAAIHAFFKYLQAEKVEYLLQCTQILSIPIKRKPKPIVHHLEEQELKAILQAIDVKTPAGRRDLALLSLLYDTGARVQEIIDLTVKDIRFAAPAIVRLTGKGRKTRSVPLMSNTANLLQSYMQESGFDFHDCNSPVFKNKQGQKLSRNGVAYILNKYATQAAFEGVSPQFNITPHVFRHSKAMHLLRADVNIFYIRDILGHSEVSTTEIYAKADAEKKRAVLEKVSNATIPSTAPRWQTDPTLINWLKNLVK